MILQGPSLEQDKPLWGLAPLECILILKFLGTILLKIGFKLLFLDKDNLDLHLWVFLSIQLYGYDFGFCMSYLKKQIQLYALRCEWETSTNVKVQWMAHVIENKTLTLLPSSNGWRDETFCIRFLTKLWTFEAWDFYVCTKCDFLKPFNV